MYRRKLRDLRENVLEGVVGMSCDLFDTSWLSEGELWVRTETLCTVIESCYCCVTDEEISVTSLTLKLAVMLTY